MASNSSTVSSTTLTCPYHPVATLIDDYHAGDMICTDCGLVVGDRIIDPSSEWRMFASDANRTDSCRVGYCSEPLLEDLNTYTKTTAETFKPPKPSSCHPKINPNMRQLMRGFTIIATMAERINAAGSIESLAKKILKQAQETYLLRYRPIEAMAAACLYIACRQEGVPRTFKEVCAVSSLSKKDIGRCFKLIVRELVTSLDHITSEDFMARFCSKLYLPLEVQKEATHIAKKAFEMNIVLGRSPISVAAAAIYLAAQQTSTMMSSKAIAEIAGVAEQTLKQSYKLLLPFAVQLFPATHVRMYSNSK